MNELYKSIGTTKQNVHQRLNRHLREQEEKANLTCIIHQARQDHPGMGADALFQLLKPETIGRDRFRQWYNELGFKLEQKRNFKRTTDSAGVNRFPNLLADAELTGVNQAFVSDITYFEMGNEWYYLTFITDLYSRRIRGYTASRTLRTEETSIPAFEQMVAGVEKTELKGAIFHSDGGGQYYSRPFRKLTAGCGIRNSMCGSVYENPHAERVNGIIKNQYLKHYNPKNFRELTTMLAKAVYMYNHYKPHQALNGLSPVQFEELLGANPPKQDVINKEKRSKKEIL